MLWEHLTKAGRGEGEGKVRTKVFVEDGKAKRREDINKSSDWCEPKSHIYVHFYFHNTAQ